MRLPTAVPSAPVKFTVTSPGFGDVDVSWSVEEKASFCVAARKTPREPGGIAEGEAKKVAGAVKTTFPPEGRAVRKVAKAATG